MRDFAAQSTLIAISFFLFIASISDQVYAQEATAGFSPKARPRQYFAKTKDGWDLSLHRYKPDKIKAGTEPVILCHGFGFNSNLWDLDEAHSFARYLQERGYDAWSVNLRGSGDSSKPVLSQIRAFTKMQITRWLSMIRRLPSSVTKIKWSIDDHVNQDVPAILEFVKKETGSDQVLWMGHSMGGIIMYCYLATHDQSDIKGLVTIGSAIYTAEPPDESSMVSKIISQKPIRRTSLLVNMTIPSQIRNLTLGMAKLPWEERYYNHENMDRLTAIRMFRLCVNDTSNDVVAQYSDLLMTGELRSMDGKINYTKLLDRIDVPLLIAVGSKDASAPMDTVRYAYDRVSSRDKTIVEFSKANGYSADYGHSDVLLGRRSKEEIYPYLYNWLDR